MPRNYFAKDTDLTWDVRPTEIKIGDQIIDSHYALIRTDNNKVLDLHKNSYNPFYNVEFKSLLDDLQKITGFEELKYSEFKDGKTVLGYLKNNQKDVNINGFEVDQYLVLGNTHDGSKGIFLGTSEVMLRCMNEFGKIVKSNVIKHTKNNHYRIDELKRAYEVYFNQLEKLKETYKKLREVSIDPQLIESLTKRLFEIDNIEEKISTRKENQMLDFKGSLVSETKDLGSNLFGFFHATTHYTTHKLKGENVTGNLFGTANKINERAFDLVTELIR